MEKFKAKVFGGKCMGDLHVKLQTHCQDSFEHKVLPSGRVLIAVADGLGSAAKSEIGSDLAVKTAVAEYAAISKDSPPADLADFKETAKKTLEACRKAIETKADAEKAQPRDLACTLILVLCGEGRVWVAHVGDGAVVARIEGNLDVVSASGDSEYANEVTPLTSKAWENEVEYKTLEKVEAVAVFTDGCQRAAFAKRGGELTAHEKFFNPLFNFAQKLDASEAAKGRTELEALLGSPKICENSDDDKTLVIAVVGAPHVGPPAPRAPKPPPPSPAPPTPSGGAASGPGPGAGHPPAPKPKPGAQPGPKAGPAAANAPKSGQPPGVHPPSGNASPAPPAGRAPQSPQRGRSDRDEPDDAGGGPNLGGIIFVAALLAIAAVALWYFTPAPGKPSDPAKDSAVQDPGVAIPPYPPPLEGPETKPADPRIDRHPPTGKPDKDPKKPVPSHDPKKPAHAGKEPEVPPPPAETSKKPEEAFPKAFLDAGINAEKLFGRGQELHKKDQLVGAYAAFRAAEELGHKDAGEKKVSLSGKLSEKELTEAMRAYGAIENQIKARADAKKAAAIVWIKIPPGKFKMGSDRGEPNEKPIHDVSLPAFEMSNSEVTEGQYKACMDAGKCPTPHTEKGCVWNEKEATLSKFPVKCVDWEQALAFCLWQGGSLPTEAQWEYAARSAGKSWDYPWGDKPPTCAKVVMHEGGDGCGKGSTAPVCSKPEGNTKQGLCDMAGNVAEWVRDPFVDYVENTQMRPPQPEGDSNRAFRGGMFTDSAVEVRASRRRGIPPGDSYPSLGFRCARDAGK